MAETTTSPKTTVANYASAVDEILRSLQESSSQASRQIASDEWNRALRLQIAAPIFVSMLAEGKYENEAFAGGAVQRMKLIALDAIVAAGILIDQNKEVRL
ncbi:MAG: hypothetical protein JSS51_04065 [Planctomycetes bacterium]|nr:hypothetical protein [Planctomycetota bacterium]